MTWKTRLLGGAICAECKHIERDWIEANMRVGQEVKGRATAYCMAETLYDGKAGFFLTSIFASKKNWRGHCRQWEPTSDTKS